VTSTTDPFSVEGKVAVITGAASGIGRATAITMAEGGATVVLGDRDENGLLETAKSVGEHVVVPTDVTRAADVEALVGEATSRYGRVDLMANIAGVMSDALIVDLTEDELDRVLAINVKGVFFGVQAALRAMGETGGSIVNMSSTAIDLTGPTIAAYAMSKAAVAMLTKTAAMEGGPRKIRVNAVAPGYVATPMTQRVGEERARMMRDVMSKASPLRALGEPDDIAWTVRYLASDAARFVTGQILRPNGGVSMPW
jgi:3-oxoacyl-[acyl-carrier protein] reductase